MVITTLLKLESCKAMCKLKYRRTKVVTFSITAGDVDSISQRGVSDSLEKSLTPILLYVLSAKCFG